MMTPQDNVVFGLLGTNGPVFQEVLRLVETVLQTAFQETQLTFVQKNEAMPALHGATGADDTQKAWLMASNFPTTPLIEDLKSIGAPVLVAVDDPVSAVAFHCQSNDQFWDHLRATSACFATIATAAAALPCPILNSSSLTQPFADVVNQILSAYGLPAPDGHLDSVLDRYLWSPDRAVTSVSHPWGDLIERRRSILGEAPLKDIGLSGANLTPDQVDQTTGVLSSAHAALLGQPRQSAVWPASVFFHGDALGETLPERFDLVGPPRRVCYGPYLCLHRGIWTIQIACGFSVQARGTPIRFEIENGDVCGQIDVRPTQPGYFRVTMTVPINLPQEPIQLTTTTLAGAIHGAMSLAMVTLTPEGSPVPDLHVDRSGIVSVRL